MAYQNDVVKLAHIALDQPLDVDQTSGTWSWLILCLSRVRTSDKNLPAQLLGRYMKVVEMSTPTQAAHVLFGLSGLRFQTRGVHSEKLTELAFSGGQQVWNLPQLICAALVSCPEPARKLLPQVADRVLEGHHVLPPQGCAEIIRAHVLAEAPLDLGAQEVLLKQLMAQDPVPVMHVKDALKHVSNLQGDIAKESALKLMTQLLSAELI